MTVSICTGGIAALFVYFGADWIEAKFFSKYSGIAVPLRVLAPTIFIVAVMGVFRGLFQGHRTMLPTAISQIFEQVVNAFVSVGAAYFFMRAHSASPKLPAWGAAGGTLGTCIGAVTALIILLFIYMMYRPVMRKPGKKGQGYNRRVSCSDIQNNFCDGRAYNTQSDGLSVKRNNRCDHL